MKKKVNLRNNKAAVGRDYTDSIIESMIDTLIVVDPDGKIKTINRAAVELLGYEKKSLIGKPVVAILAEEEEEEEELVFKKSGLADLMRNGFVRNVEKTYLSKEGRKIPVLFSGSVLRDNNGQIQGIVCLGLDITKRKKVEEDLRKAKEHAESYLNIAGVMLGVVNSDEGIAMINKKGCEMLGYGEEELVGRNWFDLLVPEGIRDDVRGVFRRLMAGEIKSVEYYENPLLTKGGDERLVAFHNAVTTGKAGRITGALFSAEDITERRKLEEEIAEISMREREKLRRDLHDSICQQLAAIGFLAQKLHQDMSRKTAADSSSAAEIGELASETIQLTQQIVEGLEPLPDEPHALMTALEGLASHVNSVYGIRCRAGSRRHVLIENQDAATHLFLIAREAVNNAVRHSQAGRIDISLSEGNNTVMLTVQDDGIGLPKNSEEYEGIGMDIMRSRARLIGASFRLGPAKTGGIAVTCSWKKGPENRKPQ